MCYVKQVGLSIDVEVTLAQSSIKVPRTCKKNLLHIIANYSDRGKKKNGYVSHDWGLEYNIQTGMYPFL